MDENDNLDTLDDAFLDEKLKVQPKTKKIMIESSTQTKKLLLETSIT